jgi:hypothetical protein
MSAGPRLGWKTDQSKRERITNFPFSIFHLSFSIGADACPF